MHGWRFPRDQVTGPREVASRISGPFVGGWDPAVMIDLVMWDLDETLLPTQHLRDARHRTSPCNLAQLAAFDGTALHVGISDAVLGITGVRTGLVTSSPRWYVEQLLDCFLPDVDFDVVVTYEDVTAIKPDPEPLLLGLRMLGSDPSRAVYIGDDLVDHQACTAAGVRFLGAGWADAPTYPIDAEGLAHPLDILAVVGST